jgi:serine/threonine protein kinase
VIGMAETVDIGAGIAAGLEHLHDSGIVHFDVKSPNVLLSFDLQSVRLCDLGHAGYRAARNGAFPHPVCGTPVTAAPEVLDGAPASFPADVWSLGMVLLEMAQLELPFEGLTYSQVIAAVVHCERAVTIPDFLPEEFAGLLRSCLQYDPRLRPSAASVGASLRAWRASAQREALGDLQDFMEAGRTEAPEEEPAAPEAPKAPEEGRRTAPRIADGGCFSFLRMLFT